MKPVHTQRNVSAYCQTCDWMGHTPEEAAAHASRMWHHVRVRIQEEQEYQGHRTCGECGGQVHHPTWYPDPCPACEGKGYT